MKIILLCGNKSNQLALAVKVRKEFNLIGIVKEDKKEKRSLTLPYLVSKLADRILFFKIASSWHALLTYYQKNYKPIKDVEELTTNNINSNDVVSFIKRLQPDLVMVSGTSLIKKNILELQPPKGIINLHTGLSPYVRGGPNCTNWCIANNSLHLIGNTVMWIDKGIDSGNIITSETVPFKGNESLNGIHLQVMEHAHQLYLKTLHCIQTNYENCPSVKQTSIAKGELFLTKMWNFNAKLRFVFHLLFLKKRMQTISKIQIQEVKLP